MAEKVGFEAVEADKSLTGRHCIHITRARSTACRKPVEADGPNGWLCWWHQQVVIGKRTPLQMMGMLRAGG